MAINVRVLTVLATATVVFGLAGQVRAAPDLSVLWAFGGLEANDGKHSRCPSYGR